MTKEMARALEEAIDRRRLSPEEARDLVRRVLRDMPKSDKTFFNVYWTVVFIVLSFVGFIFLRLIAMVQLNPTENPVLTWFLS